MPIYLVIFVSAWAIAQGAKYILQLSNDKEVKFRTVISESGGMPSSHSSVVIAIATYTGFDSGIYSPIFGIAFVFSMIVLYDAMKVRYSVGKQAETLNKIIETSKIKVPKVRIVKGHTPLEVAVGSAIGLIVGYLAFFISHF